MANITLLLHNIRSAHNVGSIFRTADGMGVTRIILSGYTPYPSIPNDSRLPHIRDKLLKQIDKVALGATASVPYEYHDNPMSWLSTSTLPVVGLEQTASSVSIAEFTPPNDFVMVIGEEVSGIDSELLKRCDTTIEIPMYGSKESFNVSVATGIALYALQMTQPT